MMQYSALDRRPEEWFDFITKQGASVVSRGTVAKGLLTNEWAKRLQKHDGYLSYSQQQLTDTLGHIADAYPDVLSAAIGYNLAHPAVASTIVGASNVAQLTQNIDAYHRLPADFDYAALAGLTKKNCIRHIATNMKG